MKNKIIAAADAAIINEGNKISLSLFSAGRVERENVYRLSSTKLNLSRSKLSLKLLLKFKL